MWCRNRDKPNVRESCWLSPSPLTRSRWERELGQALGSTRASRVGSGTSPEFFKLGDRGEVEQGLGRGAQGGTRGRVRSPKTYCAAIFNVALVASVLFMAGCDGGQAPPPPPAPAAPKPVAFDPSVSMREFKPGQFTRVTDTRQRVSLTRGFWIGTHEVTQQEFESVMGSNPSFFKGETLPVDKVSFEQAVAFCKALTTSDRKAGRIATNMIYRLPTEAEWEYACLAGATTAFSFGDSEAESDAHAWSAENADDKTNPVGQKKPNGKGLYDMHGNVWEWVVDWFAAHPKAEQLVDPSGPPEGRHRVFKGGGWYHEAKYGRSTSRFMMEPGMGINFVGFRVVLAETR